MVSAIFCVLSNTKLSLNLGFALLCAEEVKARQNQVGAHEIMSCRLHDEVMHLEKPQPLTKPDQPWGLGAIFATPSHSNFAEFSGAVNSFVGSLTGRPKRSAPVSSAPVSSIKEEARGAYTDTHVFIYLS